jgi:hypothetical protein
MNHWKNNEYAENLLVINRSDNYCANCSKGTTLTERFHTTVTSWSDEERAKPGCGTEFLYVASDYVGLRMRELCDEKWPHLEWVGIDEEKWRREVEAANANVS